MANHLSDIVEILMMAFALGMDAFSLAIGVGMQGIVRRRALVLAVCIGLFHVVLTFAGLYVGLLVQGMMGQLAKWFGAFLLLGLGIHMAYSSLFSKEESPASIGKSVGATLLFSAGVSIDALSVGFSLGLRSTAFGIISAATFGIVAALMCLFGLGIGKKANQFAGKYSELIGAFILMGYGVHFMFS